MGGEERNPMVTIPGFGALVSRALSHNPWRFGVRQLMTDLDVRGWDAHIGSYFGLQLRLIEK